MYSYYYVHAFFVNIYTQITGDYVYQEFLNAMTRVCLCTKKVHRHLNRSGNVPTQTDDIVKDVCRKVVCGEGVALNFISLVINS